MKEKRGRRSRRRIVKVVKKTGSNLVFFVIQFVSVCVLEFVCGVVS